MVTTKNECRGSITITLANGEKKRLYARGKTKKEVNIRLAELKTKYELGILVLNSNTTLLQWTNEWLTTYKKPKVTDGWYKDIENILKKWILPDIGQLQISKIKPAHLQACINKMEGKSWSYVNKTIVIIKDLFNRALENELIKENPARNIEKPRVQRNERRHLTEIEREEFLEACEQHPYGGFFAIMLACGLRPAEARALTWFDVDAKNKTIRISQSVENHSSNIKDPKSEAGKRVVPLPDWYMPYIANTPKQSNFVFTNSKNSMIGTKCMKKNWDEIAMAANLPEYITPYYLRHTYATSLAENGVDMKTAQYLLGHSNISVTAKVYTHVSEKMLDNAREKINQSRKNNLSQMTHFQSLSTL